jgi:copper chaperone
MSHNVRFASHPSGSKPGAATMDLYITNGPSRARMVTVSSQCRPHSRSPGAPPGLPTGNSMCVFNMRPLAAMVREQTPQRASHGEHRLSNLVGGVLWLVWGRMRSRAFASRVARVLPKAAEHPRIPSRGRCPGPVNVGATPSTARIVHREAVDARRHSAAGSRGSRCGSLRRRPEHLCWAVANGETIPAPETSITSRYTMHQLTMDISGMSCGGCVNNVRKALDALPGTHVDAVTVGSATVTYDESQVTPAAIAQAVTAAGYHPVESPAMAGAAVGAGTAGKAGGCRCG